jgi:uncharacterized membrane protein YfcA
MNDAYFINVYDKFLSHNIDPLFLPILSLAVVCVAISKSGFGGGLGGLGFPIMVLVLPPKVALAVFLPLILLTDIWVVYVWRKFFIFEIIWMMVLGGVIGQVICWIFFDYLNDKTILILIGLMALITSLKYLMAEMYNNKKLRDAKDKIKPTLLRAITWCSLSGFSSFIAWAGAIPAQIFLLPIGIDRRKFVATMSFYFFLINFTKIPFFINLNILSYDTMFLSLILIPILPFGIVLGKWLNLKLSDKMFYHISHIALFLCGINLITKQIF